MFFLRSSERDPVFNGVAGRSTQFIPFPGWTLFFSTVLSCLFPRTDRLGNGVVKAERDMIVYQRRTGSSPCVWRRANLGAYCAIICCSSFSIFLLSHFFQLSVFLSTTHNIMTLTVAFPVAISNIQQVLIPFVGIRHVRNPLLLLVIVNKSSAHLF